MSLCLELLNGGLAKGDLTSTELRDLEAPLLLCLTDQKALGLVIDLNAEVVHSQALGEDLKLVCRDGLLGLRLLLACLGEESPAEEAHGQEEAPPELDALSEDDEESGDPTSDLKDEDLHGAATAYLSFDEMPGRTMNKSQTAKVDHGIKEVTQQDHHMWNQISGGRARRHSLLPRGCRTFLLEIFAGAAILSHIVASDYGLPISEPIDIRTGRNINLLTKAGRDEVERIIGEDDPYAITCAPVCTMWSSWTNMCTGSTCEDILREREEWRPVIKWIFKIAKQRLALGRQFLMEHPWGSAVWNLPEAHDILTKPPMDQGTMEYLEAVRADLCQYGLKDAVTGLPHMKPTGFLAATKNLKRRLLLRCPRLHQHQPLEGGSRCRAAQQWTSELCHQIALGIIESVDDLYTRTAFSAEADLNIDALFDAIHSYEDEDQSMGQKYLERKEQEQQEVLVEEAPPLPCEELEAKKLMERRERWRRLPHGQRVALRRLHHMTGHSSPSAMQRLLDGRIPMSHMRAEPRTTTSTCSEDARRVQVQRGDFHRHPHCKGHRRQQIQAHVNH